MSTQPDIPQNELFATGSPQADLDNLVALARQQGGSRLLVLAGKPVLARVNGSLTEPLFPGRIHFRQTELLAAAILPADCEETLNRDGSVEFDYSPATPADAPAVRINIFFGDGAHNLVVFLADE